MGKFVMAFAFLMAASAAFADGTVAYTSDFSGGTAGWAGRAGAGQNMPDLHTGMDDAKEEGKSYAWVLTDGAVGSGFTLKPRVVVEAGKEYVLSFWFKAEGRLPATYRISSPDGCGETSNAWHPIPDADGKWVRVECAFTAAQPSIGLEIGVNAMTYSPSKICIYGVKITPNF